MHEKIEDLFAQKPQEQNKLPLPPTIRSSTSDSLQYKF